ncbi:MAG TPA: hypothetical protein DCM38_02345 [Gammaproteobacteria bacterium]|nr:hypothetical protein [Gammaproteobacteria bacterium]
MKLKNVCFVILLTVYYNSAYAGEVRLIELKDGSVISGEIISFSHGIYTLKSSSLGILTIEDAKIRSIDSKSNHPTTEARVNPSLASSILDLDGLQDWIGESSDVVNSPLTLSNTSIQGLIGSMMSNPDIMNVILSLQNDPDFQSALQEPDVMKAISSGNLDALISNPTFMKLLEHPQVQELSKHQ